MLFVTQATDAVKVELVMFHNVIFAESPLDFRMIDHFVKQICHSVAVFTDKMAVVTNVCIKSVCRLPSIELLHLSHFTEKV